MNTQENSEPASPPNLSYLWKTSKKWVFIRKNMFLKGTKLKIIMQNFWRHPEDRISLESIYDYLIIF